MPFKVTIKVCLSTIHNILPVYCSGKTIKYFYFNFFFGGGVHFSNSIKERLEISRDSHEPWSCLQQDGLGGVGGDNIPAPLWSGQCSL